MTARSRWRQSTLRRKVARRIAWEEGSMPQIRREGREDKAGGAKTRREWRDLNSKVECRNKEGRRFGTYKSDWMVIAVDSKKWRMWREHLRDSHSPKVAKSQVTEFRKCRIHWMRKNTYNIYYLNITWLKKKILYYNAVIWPTPEISSVMKQTLLSTSANALRSCMLFGCTEISFERIHLCHGKVLNGC